MATRPSTVKGTDGKPRCGWASADPLYEKYHDSEWGRPLKDDQALFELLTLEGCQAGLSWITVLRKRENYRKAYDGFDAKKIAKYTPAKLAKLLADPGIIRHRGKIEASVSNAKAYLAIVEREGSFAKFLWSFVGGKPLKKVRKTLKDVPAKSPESRPAAVVPYGVGRRVPTTAIIRVSSSSMRPRTNSSGGASYISRSRGG